MNAKPLITLRNVNKKFNKNGERELLALQDIDLQILDGEFFVFVGPSGCGKSTLLRLMSGLEKNHDGTITYEAGITPRDFSFVFQQFAVLPWLTIYENIAIGLVARHLPAAEIKERTEAELKLLGLQKFADSRPRELSGGMRQRVGIARALATNPKVIFMDEPFSELDSFTAEELRNELLGIWKERGMTIVLVTHIVAEAAELANRIAVMTPRPGRIEKIVENKLPRPREKRAPEFFHLEDELYRLIKP